MICCKIVANYNNTEGNFSGLIKDLGKKGEILLFKDHLFFSDCVNNIDKKFLSKVLKKNNYKEFFINEYTEENQPQESEFINGWLFDKLIKISYNMYEKVNQEKLREIWNKIDFLTEELKKLEENTTAEVKED